MGAASQLEKLTSNTSSKTDDIWNLFNYGAKAYIDKETRADDKTMPGVEDQYYGQTYAQSAVGGMNPTMLLLLAAVGVGAFLIIKKAG